MGRRKMVEWDWSKRGLDWGEGVRRWNARSNMEIGMHKGGGAGNGSPASQ